MTPKPNVILVLADDMGFADLGVKGSEIWTPNIDGLAKNGIMDWDQALPRLLVAWNMKTVNG